jgi:hypothetical protein
MSRRRFVVAVALLALWLASSASAYWTSPELDSAASWLAQRRVEVRCLTEAESADDFVIASGASAYVDGWFDRRGRWHPVNHTVFGYGVCETLIALLAGEADEFTVSDLAWALLVLTHESGHLRGHRWSADEAKTECWAIRHVGYVAARFGLDDSARRLIVAYALEHHRALPDVYHLPGCKLPEPGR